MEETKNETMQETEERNFALSEKEATEEESYKSGSVQYIDSREVAEMIGKRHPDLKRDIKRYIGQLDMSKIAHIEFFTDSTYRDSENREQSCYLVTLKGCEFIAHKLTGKKGTEFTARYINRFHEMKDELVGRSESVDVLADTVKEYMLYQEKRNEEQAELLRRQMEFSQKLMERLEKLEGRKAGYKANPYQAIEENTIESRKKELYRLTAKVAELCHSSHTRILHQMYRTLEDRLGIVLDSYKSAYHSETGWQDAGMVEVIAANDWLYEKAVDMNKFVIERKQIYG